MAQGGEGMLPPISHSSSFASASAGVLAGLPQEPSGSGRPKTTERALEVYNDFADQTTGMLPISQLGDLLASIDINNSYDNYRGVVASVAGPNADALSKEQTMAVCGMLSSSPANQPQAEPLSPSPSGFSNGTPSNRPLKPVLTKNRYYLETGVLAIDEAVVQYMQKLEEHRRRCEAEGRYQEAKVAAKRLTDLRTAQVDRMRQDLVANQSRELGEVQAVYGEETAKFHHIWDMRIKEYENNVIKAVEDLKVSHQQQMAAFVEGLQGRRPSKPRHSRDYLQQREVQEKLAKAKLYGRATKVKEMADELYQAELEATLGAWEAESKLKIAKLQAKQQQEYEALLQRGAKGRDELELKRVSETERRTLRFRNIIAELENLHKLEVVHLENFLDGQVQAGKAAPLKDGFKRRREQLLSTAF